MIDLVCSYSIYQLNHMKQHLIVIVNMTSYADHENLGGKIYEKFAGQPPTALPSTSVI